MSDSTIDYQKFRLDGVYLINNEGDLMLRIKAPAGVLSVEQARKVCDITERFTGGMLHLTTRGSIELHWLRHTQLPEIARMLASVGLTTRGACGGAVRGIACSTTVAPGFEIVQVLARKLQRHFAGNPRFEGLPKKFKIAVEAGYKGARHLIQDVGLVLVGCEDGINRYDVWIAGGLGREPRPGFLFKNAVEEGRIIPLIEAIVRTYAKNTPPPKRLKYLAATLGEAHLTQLIEAERAGHPESFGAPAIEGSLTPSPAAAGALEVPVFAGELPSSEMRKVLAIAKEQGQDFIALTSDQNLAFIPADASARQGLETALKTAGFLQPGPQQVLFRMCPGSHACKMGLSPTRDLAAAAIDAMGAQARELSWAVSGCPNACSQPQLADYGIITRKRTKDAEGNPVPLYDLCRRSGESFGETLAEGLRPQELLERIAAIG